MIGALCSPRSPKSSVVNRLIGAAMRNLDGTISRRSFISSALGIGALGLISSMPTKAYASENVDDGDQFNLADISLSKEEAALIEKISSIGDSFFFDENQCIATSLTDDLLISDYGFEESELLFLKASVIGKYIPENDPPMTRLHVEGTFIYISHTDLVAGSCAALWAAAQSGPAALGAALTALATLIGGPVGTAIGAILGFLGAASLATLCGMIIWAVANGRGIRIGLVAQFPPIVMEYW